jgi:DNA-binding transcriptional LysR family regulator
MIDLRLATCALELDRHRSFARAAAVIGVTQPTFSRSIAALEADLGVRLFDRTSRHVEPTAAGCLFLDRAKRLLEQAARLREELGDIQELRAGQLRIGAGPYALEIGVIDAAGRLAELHPAVRIEIVEGQWRELIPRLLSGEFELVVSDAALSPDEPRVVAEALPPHQGHFVCRPGHPLAGRSGLSLEDILAYPIVGVRLPARIAGALQRAGAKGGTDPLTGDFLPQIITTSAVTARALVKRSDGVCLAAARQVEEDIRRTELVRLECELPGFATRYGVAHLRDRQLSPAAQVFVQLLQEVEAGMVG